MSPELDYIAAAQKDFERHFGNRPETKAEIGRLGSEDVIVVENSVKRAFYAITEKVELIKVINLTGEE